MRGAAAIHVTKLAAAQRQLDAAIRMTLAEEDELAIHTVAAAAYAVLRDLKRKRGKRELSDKFSRGVYYIARDLVSGKLAQMPEQVCASEQLTSLVMEVADEIRKGSIRSEGDLRINTGSENNHWGKFNRPANFLKHADLDSGGLLAVDTLQNDRLLLAAAVAYIDLGGQLTPEMTALHAFLHADEPCHTSFPDQMISELRQKRTRRSRAKFCLSALRKLKK